MKTVNKLIIALAVSYTALALFLFFTGIFVFVYALENANTLVELNLLFVVSAISFIISFRFGKKKEVDMLSRLLSKGSR